MYEMEHSRLIFGDRKKNERVMKKPSQHRKSASVSRNAAKPVAQS